MTAKRAILTSASVLTLLSTVYHYAVMLRQFHRGRDGFLTQQAHYYDTVLTRHSLLTAFLIALIGNALWLTLYEWIKRSLTFAPREGEIS